MSGPRIAFAGDRDIAVNVLEFLLSQGIKPLLLLVSGPKRESHAGELRELCSYLSENYVLKGTAFRQKNGLSLMKELDLDFLICIHFPYIFPQEVISIPRIGVLNLHPAYLPYNRGWHTPSWAILENTAVGGTLHFLDGTIDTGDIIHRKQLQIRPEDTANTLYQRVKALELEVFEEAWPNVVSGKIDALSQNLDQGTSHIRQDLFKPEIQEIDLQESLPAETLIRQMRGLTTNRLDEAAYFYVNDERYRIQVTITKDSEDK